LVPGCVRAKREADAIILFGYRKHKFDYCRAAGAGFGSIGKSASAAELDLFLPVGARATAIGFARINHSTMIDP
jgi:hypothetical protein